LAQDVIALSPMDSLNSPAMQGIDITQQLGVDAKEFKRSGGLQRTDSLSTCATCSMDRTISRDSEISETGSTCSSVTVSKITIEASEFTEKFTSFLEITETKEIMTEDTPEVVEEALLSESQVKLSVSSILSFAYARAVRPDKEAIERRVFFPNFFEDPSRRTDPKFATLLAKATEVSKKHFGEEAQAHINRKTGARFMLMCNEDYTQLWGFAVYKFRPALGMMCIAKLAVPEHLQGCGFGKIMMKELIKVAKADKQTNEIGLSSLPGAIDFYKRLNFKKHDGYEKDPDDPHTYIEGQIYMDYRFRKPQKPQTGKKSKKSKK